VIRKSAPTRPNRGGEFFFKGVYIVHSHTVQSRGRGLRSGSFPKQHVEKNQTTSLHRLSTSDKMHWQLRPVIPGRLKLRQAALFIEFIQRQKSHPIVTERTLPCLFRPGKAFWTDIHSSTALRLSGQGDDFIPKVSHGLFLVNIRQLARLHETMIVKPVVCLGARVGNNLCGFPDMKKSFRVPTWIKTLSFNCFHFPGNPRCERDKMFLCHSGDNRIRNQESVNTKF
jgi:hypothetical protein